MNLTPAIQDAMARRANGGATPMQQMTPSNPAFDQSVQTPDISAPVPNVSPASSSAPTMPSPTPSAIPLQSGSQVPAGDPNATLIIKALGTYLNKKSGI